MHVVIQKTKQGNWYAHSDQRPGRSFRHDGDWSKGPTWCWGNLSHLKEKINGFHPGCSIRVDEPEDQNNGH